ncbi:MAG: 3-oxoacyl-[acyl-carrier protein] reductase [uncultured Sphingomonas sp.]|uniref:3-oxoacyl-[acyl-carrier protein] reductase n=1 Tax=uncultured Sphingomonas sp. TaxID=158754 RepID=A0A6J4S829_9SPHN|nr:SDR family oxidoreductase [uncultured Sphingomonas sp.]CAA9488704.1 MAG: 3-oxoacyl-[acyl-carrier protein] reductase [uncultured Sphingomonas sp.]
MTQPIALVTGASAGLGADFARQLLADGARLLLVARRKERIEALAAELGNARAVALDLSQADAAERLMADVAAHDEHVDLLVNNAGFGLAGRFAAHDGPTLRQMIDLNCGVLTDLAHAVLPGMLERRRGGILNVASTAAFQAGPGMAVYFATKAYVLSFTEALHEEMRGAGIHVTALCPGPVATEFAEVAGFGKAQTFNKLGAGSAEVVAAGLAALDRNQAIIVPGVVNKVAAQSQRFLPRALIRRAVGSVKI